VAERAPCLRPGRLNGVYSAGVQHPQRLRRALFTEPRQEVPIYGPFRTLAYYYVDAYIGTPPQRASVIADTGVALVSRDIRVLLSVSLSLPATLPVRSSACLLNACAGSTLIAFPCSGCGSNCGSRHMNPPFDTASSSTVRAATCGECGAGSCSGGRCTYSVHYAEGSSITGEMYNDIVWLDGTSSTQAVGDANGVRFSFGCHTQETSEQMPPSLSPSPSPTHCAHSSRVVLRRGTCYRSDHVRRRCCRCIELFLTQSADGIMGMSQSA
jgi:hypothetical protein